MSEELFEGEFYTLTDEEGNESQFELIGTCELDGNTYMALIPVDDGDEYVILKKELDDSGEEILVTIDDDEEFDRVADIFEDEIFSEVDYDGDEEQVEE